MPNSDKIEKVLVFCTVIVLVVVILAQAHIAFQPMPQVDASAYELSALDRELHNMLVNRSNLLTELSETFFVVE